MVRLLLTFSFLLITISALSQGSLSGIVTSQGQPVSFAQVAIPAQSVGTVSDSLGQYTILDVPKGVHKVTTFLSGYLAVSQTVTITTGPITLDFKLTENTHFIDEVVVTGTMKEISRMDSPIPVEIITPKFFQKNPTPSLFEAVGLVNGVKPQLNCNVCNTGDIHINGMEGPYTMILIDGMPIVSSLSTVYGLSGIPNSIVARIGIV